MSRAAFDAFLPVTRVMHHLGKTTRALVVQLINGVISVKIPAQFHALVINVIRRQEYVSV